MKLHERLPDAVTVDGKRYRVDLDFRNVLRMIDALGREDMLPGAREYVALKCVMKRPPRNTGAAIAALREMLFPGGKKQSGEKMTDFVQDADLIRAAFLQAYGINLYRDRLHWLEFTGLLACLPTGSRYADILSIRARPMPKPTKYNGDERKWLAEAKAKFAVRLTDKEMADSLQMSLHSTTLSLLALAQKGGGADG
jgi:hypothetical protein